MQIIKSSVLGQPHNIPLHINPHFLFSPTLPRLPQDVFSLGCVIAELYLDGRAFLDLGQLLSLKQQGGGGGGLQQDYGGGGGVGGPGGQQSGAAALWPPQLAGIPDADIRALVQHMVQVDPGAYGVG